MSITSLCNTHSADETELMSYIVGGKPFAVPMSQVQEILRSIPATPLQGSHPSVEGMINLRGDAIPVINLCSFLKLEQISDSSHDLLMIVKCETSQYAFRVDSVPGIKKVAPKDIQKIDRVAYGEGRNIVSAVVEIDGQLVNIPDLTAVVEEISTGTPNMEELTDSCVEKTDIDCGADSEPSSDAVIDEL